MSKLSDLSGSAFKVQYKPEFSDAFKNAIFNNLTASLVPNPDDNTDNDYGQFEIDMMQEFVEEVRYDTDLMSLHGFTPTDLELFDYIYKRLKVQFIEL